MMMMAERWMMGEYERYLRKYFRSYASVSVVARLARATETT